MRKLHLFLVVLALCVTASPAFAWEWSMTGTFNSEYRYLTQMGTNGFFGPYDLFPPAGGSEAPNLWTGIHFRQISNREISASSDVATHGMWADLNPVITLNSAIRLRGRYRVGNADWSTISIDPIYYNSFYGGVNRKFTDGGWTQFSAIASLPFGEFAVGKRPFVFGCGLLYDGTTHSSSESVSLTAPYGGLRLGISFYPSRSSANYRNRATKTTDQIFSVSFAAIYSTGPLQVGTYWNPVTFHYGPEGGAARPEDGYTLASTSYFKYNNGRVFTNAEFSQYEGARYFGPNAQGVGQGPAYIESYRYMIESGFMAGPMKVSNIYAVVTGGNWGDKDYSAPNTLPNTVVFKPYSLLLVRNYGGGTAYAATSWEGYLDNAWALGSRVDYALAANLNMWVSAFGAWRWDRSTESWGCVHPAGVEVPNGLVAFGPVAGNPKFIPNDDLGWEVYAGFDWKLLEGLRITAEGAYFAPGLWWNHACVSSSAAGATWGGLIAGTAINPYRDIDPILAFYLTTYFEF